MSPVERQLRTEVEAKGSFDLAKGATVSTKAVMERTIPLPPGELQPIGQAIMAVTDSRTLVIGDHTFEAPHNEVLGLGVPWRTVCRINDRRQEKPIYVRGRSGSLMCAMINSGIRLGEGST